MIPTLARESAIIAALTADYEALLIEFMSDYDLSFDRFLKLWKARDMSQLHLVGQDRIEYGAYLQMTYYVLLERFLLTDLASKNNIKRLATILIPEYRVLICSIATIYALYATFMTRNHSRLLITVSSVVRVTEKCLKDIDTVLTVAEHCQLGKVAEDIRSFINYLTSSRLMIVAEYSGPVSLHFLRKYRDTESAHSQPKKKKAVIDSTICWRNNSLAWQNSIETLTYTRCLQSLSSVYTFSGINPSLQQSPPTTIEEPSINFTIIAKRIQQIKLMIQHRRQEMFSQKVEKEQAIATKAAVKQRLAEDRLRKKVFAPKTKGKKRSFTDFIHQQGQQQGVDVERASNTAISAQDVENQAQHQGQQQQQQNQNETLPTIDIEAALNGDVSGFWKDFREFVGMSSTNSSSCNKQSSSTAPTATTTTARATVAVMEYEDKQDVNMTSLPAAAAVSSSSKGKVGVLLDELEAQIKGVMERQQLKDVANEDDIDSDEMNVDLPAAAAAASQPVQQASRSSAKTAAVDVEQQLAELEGSSNAILSQSTVPVSAPLSTSSTFKARGTKTKNAAQKGLTVPVVIARQQQTQRKPQKQVAAPAVAAVEQQQGVKSIEAILQELEAATSSILPRR